MYYLLVIFISIVQILFARFITSDSSLTPVAAIVGLILALAWLLWREKQPIDNRLNRRRWNCILLTSFIGIFAYIFFAVIAARAEVSGLAGLGLIVMFFFTVPIIFGISGILSRIFIR